MVNGDLFWNQLILVLPSKQKKKLILVLILSHLYWTRISLNLIIFKVGFKILVKSNVNFGIHITRYNPSFIDLHLMKPNSVFAKCFWTRCFCKVNWNRKDNVLKFKYGELEGGIDGGGSVELRSSLFLKIRIKNQFYNF